MFQPRMAPGDGEGRSCTDEIRDYWQKIPFFNKSIIVISTVIYFANLLTEGRGKGAGWLLINLPDETIKSFQIWRIFTAPFTHLSFLQLLFCLLSLIPDTTRLETLLGTVAFMFDFLVKGIEIQVLYSILMGLLSLASSEFGRLPSSGLWSLVMVYLTIRCATNPEDPTYFLCFPVVIKQKYYPFLIFLLFALFFGSPFELLVAMIVGYAEYYFFNGMMIRLSLNKASSIENSFLLASFKTRSDFLSCQSVNSPYYSGNYGNFGRQNNNDGGSSENSNPNSGSVPAIQPFSGRGVQIGGGPLPSLPNVSAPYFGNRDEERAPQRSQPPQSQNNQGSGVFAGKGISVGSGPNHQILQGTNDDILKSSPGNEDQKNTNNNYIKLQNEDTEPSQKKTTPTPLNEDLI